MTVFNRSLHYILYTQPDAYLSRRKNDALKNHSQDYTIIMALFSIVLQSDYRKRNRRKYYKCIYNVLKCFIHSTASDVVWYKKNKQIALSLKLKKNELTKQDKRKKSLYNILKQTIKHCGDIRNNYYVLLFNIFNLKDVVSYILTFT